MATLFQDLLYAFRIYLQNKSFAFIAILTLAIGVGANTALFAVIHSVLLRPLPYPQSHRIVQIYRRMTGGTSSLMSYPFFRFAERNNRTMEYLASWRTGPRVNIIAGNASHAVQSVIVSANFFRVFGVHPVKGRDFSSQDDVPGAAPVAVISHPLWKTLFGGDPNVLGRILTIKDDAYTIIGVMQPGFTGGPDADVWTPYRKSADWAETVVAHLVVGRLRPGVALEEARNDFDQIWARLRKDEPPDVSRSVLGSAITTYMERIVGDYRRPMLLLNLATVCLLLIACVNVANLLMVRAVGRRREMAVRIALGTGRGRLIRQLLTESLVLAMLGGLAGFALAVGTLRVLKHWLASQLIRGQEISLDPRDILLAIGVSALIGVAFGLAPALHLAGTSPIQMLREYGASTVSRGTHRFQAGLVCAQICLSTVILLAAGLLVVSFENLQNYDLGFSSAGVLTVDCEMKFQSTATAMVSINRVTNYLRTIPGVESVALVNQLPTEFAGLYDITFLTGPVERNSSERMFAEEPRQITPEYFDVMRIPMRSGRKFTEGDAAESAAVAIVNEAFVRKYLADTNPIGVHVVTGRTMGPDFTDRPREIIGVAADTRGERNRRERSEATVYTPVAQLPDRSMADHNSDRPWVWVVRTTGNPLSLARTVRQEIVKADPGLVVGEPRSMEEIVSRGIEQPRMHAALISSFAGMALLLAAVGLYGTMSQTVAERMRELGIRVAVGATGKDVLWLLLRYSFQLVALGTVTGIVVFFALQRLLAAYLFEVRPTDPSVLTTVLILLFATSIGAALIPALRAARIEPKIVLQQ